MKILCWCPGCEKEWSANFNYRYTGKGIMRKICPDCKRNEKEYQGECIDMDLDWLATDEAMDYNEFEDVLNG